MTQRLVNYVVPFLVGGALFLSSCASGPYTLSKTHHILKPFPGETSEQYNTRITTPRYDPDTPSVSIEGSIMEILRGKTGIKKGFEKPEDKDK